MTTQTADGTFFSINDVAELLRVSVKTVRRWIHRDGLRCLRPGGLPNVLIRIPKEDLDAFLAKDRR